MTIFGVGKSVFVDKPTAHSLKQTTRLAGEDKSKVFPNASVSFRVIEANRQTVMAE